MTSPDNWPEGRQPGQALIEPPGDDDARAAASRQWRSLWRIHFYAGMAAMPFILLMAVTGLIILYTQPIQDLTQRDLRIVEPGSQWASFDAQALAVEAAYPDAPIVSMTTSVDDRHATVFAIDDAIGSQVFVDPYTAEVLGDTDPEGDIVALSNRLHGYLAYDAWTIDLPAVSALWDGGPVIREYVVGDLVLEILGVWTLVLVLSGLYLWVPRRSRSGGTERNGRRFFSLRLSKPGRARWRDLHGLSGVAMLVVMLITIVSGMAWSTYWGTNFAALADEISPSTWTDAPPSVLGTKGDLDRLGNQINWNTGDMPLPASYRPAPDADLPAPLSLDTVAAIAAEEGMKPGWTVRFPANEEVNGEMVYGTFSLSNSWPRRTGEARDLFLDQFTGATVADNSVYGYGSVSRAMDTLVSTHMGTQLGLFSRILMTALCVLSIWSVISAFVMFWRRRRPGTLGVPRRPVDVRLSRRIAGTALALGIVFPQWGVTALAVLSFDRFVIRRVGPLRAAFGQP